MWDQKIPSYIYGKQNIVRLILWTALFALVFINIYKPFSSTSWYKVSEFKFFVFSSLIILTGVLVVVLSRIILFHWGKRHAITVRAYAIWIVLEIFFMSLFYTIYTLVLNPEREYMEVFNDSAVNTSLVLLLPYSVLHLYFSYKEKERQLRLLEENQTEAAVRQSVFSFYDEKNELRLSVKRSNLLYLESADNYVCIWYLNKGQLTKFMLRNSLKAIEESLADTNVLRCHRSFMVNFDQVKVIRREKEGVYLELGIEKVPDIPIILLTAKNTLQSRMEGLELGADAYIDKPFSMDLLLTQVTNLLNNRSNMRAYYFNSPIANIKSMAYTKADEKFLKKLNDIIDSHINDVNLDVDMIADLMNLSRPTLYRKINGLSNVTPNELIKISRLKKAAELILQGDMRIYEIAEAVGFNSQSYFSRAFSKQFNMSPSQYAKENNIELK